MARSSTSFSKENQPTKRGRKKGVKIGYSYVSSQLEKITCDKLTDFTPLTTAQILNINNFLMLQNATVLNSISTSEDMPILVRMIAAELTMTKQPLDTVYKLSDRLVKTQDTKPEQLHIDFDDLDFDNEEVENAES